MGCATGTVKYLLFIFNFVFALIGLGILIAGALSYADIKEVDQHLKNVDVNGSPIGLIVLGSIVFVIAFYGCCGAIRESHCMIVTFAVFLIIILITQIAIGIVAFVKRDGWDKILDENLSQTFDKYGTDAATNESINALQHTLQCCGVHGPIYWTTRLPDLPWGCCVDGKGPCSNFWNKNDVWQDGCVKKMKDVISGMGLLLGVLAVVFGAIEIVGVVFALCLANSIKEKERRRGKY